MLSLVQPTRTVLLVEFSGEIGYSFHQPQTDYVQVNNPPGAPPHMHSAFKSALNEVGFVDGHIDNIKIYNDGVSVSHSDDPLAGYDYQWSGG